MCYLLVTGTFSCVLKVSDRFSEYKESPENTGFSGSVALFRYSAKKQLSELCKEDISYVVYGRQDIGYSAGNIGYVMETMRKSKAQEIALQNRLSILVSMTEKYRSTIYKMQRDSIDELAKNEKPKNVVNIINQSEN